MTFRSYIPGFPGIFSFIHVYFSYYLPMEILSGEQEVKAEQWMYEAAKVATQAKCLRALCGTVIVQ